MIYLFISLLFFNCQKLDSSFIFDQTNITIAELKSKGYQRSSFLDYNGIETNDIYFIKQKDTAVTYFFNENSKLQQVRISFLLKDIDTAQLFNTLIAKGYKRTPLYDKKAKFSFSKKDVSYNEYIDSTKIVFVTDLVVPNNSATSDSLGNFNPK